MLGLPIALLHHFGFTPAVEHHRYIVASDTKQVMARIQIPMFAQVSVQQFVTQRRAASGLPISEVKPSGTQAVTPIPAAQFNSRLYTV